MKPTHDSVADTNGAMGWLFFSIWVRVRPMIMYKKCKRRNANETE